MSYDKFDDQFKWYRNHLTEVMLQRECIKNYLRDIRSQLTFIIIFLSMAFIFQAWQG